MKVTIETHARLRLFRVKEETFGQAIERLLDLADVPRNQPESQPESAVAAGI